MSSLKQLQQELAVLSSPRKAEGSSWFFKTGKGEYGYGDVFIGITVPEMRKVAKKYLNLSFVDIQKLLNSKIHEHRFVALLLLVSKFEKGKEETKKDIYNFYLKNTKRINNWDLVDTSAPYIVGAFLQDKPKDILYKLGKSKNIWERRIAIVSTYAFIRFQKFEDTIELSKLLLKDTHDLIHKAVGWMLREVGKRSEGILKNFLNQNYKIMPRTALRYSIEKFPENVRKAYLSK